MKKVIFVGAGEYAESVYDSMAKEEYDLIGFVDEYKKGYHMGKPILAATIEEVFNFRDYAYFISIGDTEPRKRQFEAVKKLGLETINIIDKTALISDSVKIGTGNFIGKMAVINIGTVIGDNNMVNSKSLIEHHCTIMNHTRIATATVMNGDVVVEDGAYLGSMACCIGQQRLGEFSIIGAGAVVLGNIEPHCTAVGVPAKASLLRSMTMTIILSMDIRSLFQRHPTSRKQKESQENSQDASGLLGSQEQSMQ